MVVVVVVVVRTLTTARKELYTQEYCIKQAFCFALLTHMQESAPNHWTSKDLDELCLLVFQEAAVNLFLEIH